MSEGDTSTGGAQVNPSNTPPSNPGSQTMGAIDSSVEDTSLLSISHDQPKPSVNQQPTPQSGVQTGAPTAPGAAANSIISPPASNVSSSATPNTTTSPTPVPYPAANINPQPQPADQLIAQTFTTNSQPTQAAAANPITQYIQTPYPQQPAARPSVQYAPDDTGDIKLTSAHPKKSKKGLIIGLILLVILAVAIGVAFAFYGPRLHNTDNSKELADIQNLFNKYANYVLRGEESTDQPQDFDIEKKYYIDENIKDNKFLENAEQLFDVFSKKFAYSEYIEKTNIPLFSTSEYYEFLMQNNNLAKINEDKLFEVYRNEGITAANNYIDNYYANVNPVNYLTSSMINSYVRYNKAMVQEWNIYDQEGCRKEDFSYDLVCIENIPIEKIHNEAAEMGNMRSLSESLISQTIEGIKDQILIYRKAIYEEDYNTNKEKQ